MLKLSILLLSIFIFFSSTLKIHAQGNPSFVSVVNPVRGNDFWEETDQRPEDAVMGQLKILEDLNTPATWLIRVDAFINEEIMKKMRSVPDYHELGLFLEVIPTWAQESKVNYHKSESWHFAESVLLTGYDPKDREKLIDTAFNKFKDQFGYYPSSVGAWWIDSYSLEYMQKKYNISAALIVADQFSTDNYQIWGQYWSTPYYPDINNALNPAKTIESKLPVVMMQWAVRDPVNGYGKGVEESTFSVQPNDYLDYHNLNTGYFSKLVDIYTTQQHSLFGYIVVGLENSYSWEKYGGEYYRQMQVLNKKKEKGQLTLLTMKDFAAWYKKRFPDVSPENLIIAEDPLGTGKQAVWFMNPYFRAGWFYDKEETVFRDIRQYISGQEELCRRDSCKEINFATSATRVLDEVTNGHKWILEKGTIDNLNVKKDKESYVLSYTNEVGKTGEVVFMPRDISVDGVVKSIDQTILDAIALQSQNKQNDFQQGTSRRVNNINLVDFSFQVIKFLIFIIGVVFTAGYLAVRMIKQEELSLKLFLSICIGLVSLTLIYYVLGYLDISWIIFPLLTLILGFSLYKGLYRETLLCLNPVDIIKSHFLAIFLISGGAVFQSLMMIRSSWPYNFSLGFFGPVGHDGIWHLALINQLIKQVPPQNPGLSGEIISNYHYFYDLLVAATSKITQIPVTDLVFRFYPVLFSLLLGLGTYLLTIKLFRNKAASLISLYFVYFAGSFGWIVEYIRERHFGGESAFWVNQPVSMNLNPPFAISLVLMIAIILTFQIFIKNRSLFTHLIFILLAGSLIEFKVYGGIIVLGALFLVATYRFIIEKDVFLIKSAMLSTLLSMTVFLPQNSRSSDLLVFQPFWFIHSMVDFSDRVGWVKLSQARMAYFERGEIFKFIATEVVGFFVFVLGNLGTRFVTLFALISFIKKRLWKRMDITFILFMACLALIIPVFFIQKGNPWNTIQFMYYFLYFVSLFVGISLVTLFKYAPKYLVFPFLGLLFLITPINAVVTFQSSLYLNPPAKLSFAEVEALTYLKNLPQGYVLTYPFDKNWRAKFKDPFPLYVYETTSYVSAFSSHPTFIEDEIQQEIFQNDYKKRVVKSLNFFQNKDYEWSKRFLHDNKIRYVYLLKFLPLSLDTDKVNLKQIYENEEVQIYEVI